MIRTSLAAGVSALVLALSSPAAAQDGAQDVGEATPTMSFGTWGVDPALLDPAVDPGDDFDAYVNGKWEAETEIPADRVGFGPFDYLAERSTKSIEDLIAELVAADPAPGTQARRIVDAYQSYLDTDAIDAAGMVPAQAYLSRIYSAPDLDALVELWGEAGFPSLVSPGVSVDSLDPDNYMVGVGFGGMGLPDRDYYLVDSERNLEIREAYKKWLTFALGEAGYADPAAAADAVYAFEHQVALVEWDKSAFRQPQLLYNVLSKDELIALVPGFPVETLLESRQFADQDRFNVSQMPPTAQEVADLGLTEEQMAGIGSGLPGMMELLTKTPLATIKAFMAAQFLYQNAPVLPHEIDDAAFAFFGQELSGQTEQRPRWKRAIAATEGQLGEQLGALYVERHFPPEAKAQMLELVHNLLRAMGEDLDRNDWLGPETLAAAKAKLASYVPLIGYPDTFKTYDGLDIVAGDPLGNRIRTTQWNRDDMRARLGKPVDKDEWGIFPQTVNAYFDPESNRIVFPAAILQAPFFDPSADPAVNYGAIGAAIGHEIGHGFDDEGSQYDENGKLRNWWTAADRAAFEERTQPLAELIAAYCPLDDGKLCQDPGLVMGETLGDLVGLQMAYHAYRLSLGGKEAPVIDGLTGDQRFFLGFAQVWRSVDREQARRRQLMSDPHPLAPFRINNTVRNLDAWYAAFGVTPDDALYLPPEKRLSLW